MWEAATTGLGVQLVLRCTVSKDVLKQVPMNELDLLARFARHASLTHVLSRYTGL